MPEMGCMLDSEQERAGDDPGDAGMTALDWIVPGT